jgi:hypothetical protein
MLIRSTAALCCHSLWILLTQPAAHASCRIGENAFLLRRGDGSQTAYNTGSLIDYILSSNDFSDPVTRIPYSLEDLVALDALAESTNLKRPSVLKAKQNPDLVQQRNEKFRRDALTGLDRCAGESVSDMVSDASDGPTVRSVWLWHANC